MIDIEVDLDGEEQRELQLQAREAGLTPVQYIRTVCGLHADPKPHA
jgi:hypothetical protein